MSNNRNKTLRIVLPLFAAALCLNAGAQTIDEQMAERIAAQYVSRPQRVNLQAQTAKGSAPPVLKSQKHVGATPYYIYNNADGQGFAIVSGDKRMGDIIGYSDTGSIDPDNIPAPLQDMLAAKAETMTAIQIDSVDILPHYPNRPKRYVKPLTSSLWNQTGPYNKYLPVMVNGDHAYTGCVALATSMVMYYYKWPKNRTGSASTCNGLTYYDWDSMTDNLMGASDKSIDAVATLIYDVAYAEESIFTTTGTSADISRAWSALQNKYDYSTRLLSCDLLASDVYMSEIYNELSEGYPVICAGGDHAFYYDGYDENGLIHCNWGWGGSSNGYFNILTVSLGGSAQNSSGNYWIDQNCVFARPNDGNHETFSGEMPVTLSVTNPKALSVVSGDSISRTGTMNIELNGVWAKNLVQGEKGAFTGGVGVGLFNADGSCLHVFPSPYGDDITWTSYLNFMSFNSSINPWKLNFSEVSGLTNGRYTLRALSRQLIDKQAKTTGNWTLILNCNQVPLEVSDKSITVQPTPGKPQLKLVGKPDVLVPVNTKGGVNGAVQIEVSNNTRYEARGTLAATLYGKGQLEGKTFPLPDNMLGGRQLIPRLGTAKVILSICTSYATWENSYQLEAGKWSLKVGLVVGEKDTLNIPMPNDYEITVTNNSGPRVMISRVDFYDGNEPTTDDYFDPTQTQTLGMGMHTMLRSTPNNYESETLRYRVIDLADSSCVFTSNNYNARLPFTESGKDADVTSQTRANVDLTSLKSGHTFEVHVDLLEGNTWTDLWNNTSLRPTFSLAPTTTGIESIAETAKKPTPAGRYNLSGQRVDKSYKGLVIENGKKIIVR